MTYAVDSGRAQPWPACTLENRVSPACGPSAQGIRAGGEFHFDGFGPVYLAPMPGGRAVGRSMDDVSSLNCAAGAACAGGGFLEDRAP
jgi:hypothetical protein